MNCLYCGDEISGRPDKKFCSIRCSARHKKNAPKMPFTRECLQCGNNFIVAVRGDANRKYCSKQCAKKSYQKQQISWHFDNPNSMKRYNQNRVAKNPGAAKEHKEYERKEMIRLLGGECIVCGVTNPYWLHIDYIPTSRGLVFRHPRHLNFIRNHIQEFRLLCANHHYELTLTGKIEGTEITQ